MIDNRQYLNFMNGETRRKRHVLCINDKLLSLAEKVSTGSTLG